MAKRRIIFFVSLLFLVSLVVTAMVSPPERAQASEVQISTITMTERVRPAEPTVRITATKPPTPNIMAATSTPTIALQIFYYSYYYPDLLAPSDIVNGVCANQENGVCHTVNCWDYDVMEGKCKSKMASGLDWHAYVSKAVAYGFEYPLGTVFRVRKPAKIAGDYPCLDRCPACTNKRQLNFLNVIQQLPWNLQLVVIVII